MDNNETRKEGIELLRKAREENKPIAYYLEVEGVYELGANIVGEFLPHAASRNFFRLRSFAENTDCANLLIFFRDNQEAVEREMTDVELVSKFYQISEENAQNIVNAISTKNKEEAKKIGENLGKFLSAAVQATVRMDQDSYAAGDDEDEKRNEMFAKHLKKILEENSEN